MHAPCGAETKSASPMQSQTCGVSAGAHTMRKKKCETDLTNPEGGGGGYMPPAMPNPSTPLKGSP